MSATPSIPTPTEPLEPDARLLRRPAVWVYAVAVLAGLVVVIPRLVSMTSDPDMMLVAWLGALVQAGVLLLFGWLILPKRRAAASTVLLAILIGATFCVGVTIVWGGLIDHLNLERLIFVAGFEEVIKFAGVAIVLWMLGSRLRGPLDGLIVGFFVGYGFAIVEHILYTFTAENMNHAWSLVIARLFTQLGTHVIFTGIAGAGLAYLIVTRGRGWAIAVAAFATSLTLHLVSNGSALVLPSIGYLAVALLLIVVGIVLFIVTRRMSAAYEARHAIVREPAL